MRHLSRFFLSSVAFCLFLTSLTSGQKIFMPTQTNNPAREFTINKVGNSLQPDQKRLGFSLVAADGVATLDISVAVGSNIGSIGRLQFKVQPVRQKQKDGDLVDVGNPVALNLPAQLSVISKNGIVAEPKITFRASNEATIVRIVVRESEDSEEVVSLLLPIRQTVASAVLIQGYKCKQVGSSFDEGHCTWFTGTCGSDCGGQMFCVGCNNGSPNLNCAACSMDCGQMEILEDASRRPRLLRDFLKAEN